MSYDGQYDALQQAPTQAYSSEIAAKQAAYNQGQGRARTGSIGATIMPVDSLATALPRILQLASQMRDTNRLIRERMLGTFPESTLKEGHVPDQASVIGAVVVIERILQQAFEHAQIVRDQFD